MKNILKRYDPSTNKIRVISDENIESFYPPSSAIPSGFLCKLHNEPGLYIIEDNIWGKTRKILDIEVDEYVCCSDGYIYYNTYQNNGLYRLSLNKGTNEHIIDFSCHGLYSYGECVFFLDSNFNSMYQYLFGKLTKINDNYCSDIHYPFYLNWKDEGKVYMISYDEEEIKNIKITDEAVFNYYIISFRDNKKIYYSSEEEDGILKIYTSHNNKTISIDFRPLEICGGEYPYDVYLTSLDEKGIFTIKDKTIIKVLDVSASSLVYKSDFLYFLEQISLDNSVYML